MARSRARRAAESARAALKAGWSFRALMTVRRALAVTPDDPELLALYAESLRQVDRTAGQRAVRRAAHVRILEARERVAAGKPEEAMRILRAVLKEDPQNREALEALGDLERARPRADAPEREGRRGDDGQVLAPRDGGEHRRGPPPARRAARSGRSPPRSRSPARRAIAHRRGRRSRSCATRPRRAWSRRRRPRLIEQRRRRRRARGRGDASALFAGQDPALRQAVEDVLARYGARARDDRRRPARGGEAGHERQGAHGADRRARRRDQGRHRSAACSTSRAAATRRR